MTPCSTVDCPNTGRFVPTIHVYYTQISDHHRIHPRPQLLPVGVEFHHLRLCRSCKQQPETLLRSLWPEVEKELFAKGLSPSNAIKPFVNFEVMSQAEID